MKIFLANENIFYRMKIYFIEWKYIFIEWKYILSNGNIFYRMKIYFIEWKYFNIELCYFSATIDHSFSFSLFSNIKGKALQKCCSSLFVALKFFNFENVHLRWKQLESTVGSESVLKGVQQCTIAAFKQYWASHDWRHFPMVLCSSIDFNLQMVQSHEL